MDAAAPPDSASVPAAVRALVDGLVDGAILVDGEHRVLHHNAAYAAALARRPRELERAVAAGARCCDLLPLEVCEEGCVVRRALAGGRTVRLDEIAARPPGGDERRVIVSAIPVGGGLCIETYRDVTAEDRIQRRYKALLDHERRAKELLEREVAERTAELRQAHAALAIQERMSSLGRLVAGVAHELNNPIHFIYGNADFLQGYFEGLLGLVRLFDEAPELPPAVRERAAAKKEEIELDYLVEDLPKLIRSIRIGAERAAGIVKDLRTYSHAGSTALADLDVADGLRATLDLLRPLTKERITIAFDVAADLPRVRCQPGQINQVFMNVLTNAVQAIRGPGRIEITARATAGGGVRVVVRDTGPGISPEVLPRIFEPFFTTKDPGEGTGLGLAICDGIVRRHGGRLAAANHPEAGAELTLELPPEPPADAPPP